jgi:hypothetical protein
VFVIVIIEGGLRLLEWRELKLETLHRIFLIGLISMINCLDIKLLMHQFDHDVSFGFLSLTCSAILT